MSSAGTVRNTGITPDSLNIPLFKANKKGADAPFLMLGSARATKHAAWIAKAEAITLTCLVAHVAGIEVAFKAGFHGHTLEHLHAVGGVSLDEPCIRVSQIMVHSVALGQHAHVLNRVDVVVCSTNTQSGLQDAISGELQFLRNDELQTTNVA